MLITNNYIQNNIEKLINRKEKIFNYNHLFYKNKIVLITGAGSIGSSIAKYCNAKEIHVIDIDEAKLHRLKREIPTINIHVMNLLFNEKLHKLMNEIKPDIVFHTAAYKFIDVHENDVEILYYNNIQSTRNVIKSCEHNKVKSLVFTSTDKAAGAISEMGLSKYFSELELFKYSKNTEIFITRYGNVLFSTGSILNIVKENIENSDEKIIIPLTDEKMKRFFITMKEAANFTLLLPITFNQGIYYYKTEEQSVKELIENYLKLLQINENDYEFKNIGIRYKEKLNEIYFKEEWEESEKTNIDDIYRIIYVLDDENMKRMDELKYNIYKICPKLLYTE